MERYSGVKFKVKIKTGKVKGIKTFLGIDHRIREYLNPKRNEGNMSMRKEDGFLIKRTGAEMTRLGKKDVVLVKNIRRGYVYSVGGIPSSESLMHYEIYKRRKDAKIVLHFHADDLLGKTRWLRVRYHPYGSIGLAKAVGRLSKKTNKIEIPSHGFVIIAVSKASLFEMLKEIQRMRTPQTGQTTKKLSS